MEHVFIGRFTGNGKGSPVFLLETFRWKCMFHLRVFTLCNHKFLTNHGDICATILNETKNERNLSQMEHY